MSTENTTEVEPTQTPEIVELTPEQLLEKKLDETLGELTAANEKVRDFQDKYIRLNADFDNYRKRAIKDREEGIKFGNERLLKDFLPVIDNLERALAATNAEPSSVIDGVKMVLKLFVDTLGKHGVKSIVSEGDAFDPNKHEALMQQDHATIAAGHIVSEFAKGYYLNDKLIRPATVIVSKGSPEDQLIAQTPEAQA